MSFESSLRGRSIGAPLVKFGKIFDYFMSKAWFVVDTKKCEKNQQICQKKYTLRKTPVGTLERKKSPAAEKHTYFNMGIAWKCSVNQLNSLWILSIGKIPGSNGNILILNT